MPEQVLEKQLSWQNAMFSIYSPPNKEQPAFYLLHYETNHTEQVE